MDEHYLSYTTSPLPCPSLTSPHSKLFHALRIRVAPPLAARATPVTVVQSWLQQAGIPAIAKVRPIARDKGGSDYAIKLPSRVTPRALMLNDLELSA